MRRTAGLASISVLLLAGLLLTASSSFGSQSARSSVAGIFANPNGIRGTILANQAKAVISLHGLTPNTSYRVVASSKPCSSVDTSDSVIWRIVVVTGEEDNVFAVRALDNSIPDGPQIKSLGVVDNGDVFQICTRARHG